MNELDHLQIDLADPEDIRAKLGKARAILEAKRARSDAAIRDFENYRHLVERLEMIAGERDDRPRAAPKRRKSAPAQDAAVSVVNRAERPMNPVAVYEALRDAGFPAKNPNAVNSALYAAANNGRIKKHGHGMYAPLGYEPPEGDDLLASQNGSDREPTRKASQP